jgi:hypothetical protein
VVINDFHVFCPNLRPTKADTPLIVDTNAVLTGTITLECLKVIAGWHPQIIKSTGDLELSKLTPRNLGNVHKPSDTLAFRECFGVCAFV